MPSLAGVVLDMVNGRGQDAAGGHRRGRARPQAWESFEEHREWQFEEQQWNAADSTSPSQHVQQFVANALQRAGDGSWWSIARGAMESFSDPRSSERDGGDSYDGSVDPDRESHSEPSI